MAGDRVQRRMAAIVAADVVGYSRLMGANEVATLASLRVHRRELIDPKIAEHEGRIVKLTGDGMLVEFRSVVNAVTCAAEIQREMIARNSDVPTDERMEFRVGVNVGDVVVEGDDIFGDGVNVAARLEAIADPGGIAISAAARDHVGRRLDLAFEDMGEQVLKNIDQPIRIWRWHPAHSGKSKDAQPISPQAGHSDFPSLAVLPFQNLSGDAEQEYFADGVVEDLITALSRFKSFAVIARNSSFIYKGRTVDVRQVARELGCRYVVEGSVRRAGNRLRISAQLIDSTSGSHLWAHNFDGAVEDVFDVQDQITERVVAVVEPQIQQAEINRSRRERPESLAAYDLYLRALQKLNLDRPEDNAAALELLDQAITLEPGYAIALAHAAYGFEHRVTMGWPPYSDDDAKKSLQLARAALAVAEGDAIVLARCGIVLQLIGREYDQGLLTIKRAVESNPNNLTVIFVAGIGHLIGGSLEEALSFFKRAIRLSPADSFAAMTGVGQVQILLGNYEEAVNWAERSLAMNPNWQPTRRTLIAANAHLGRLNRAKRELSALQELEPAITLARVKRGVHTKDPSRFEVIIEGLRLAGMREG